MLRHHLFHRCALGVLLLATLSAAPLGAAELLVLEFELNDLTLYPKTEEEEARTASLRPLLLDALGRDDAVSLADLPESAAEEAAKGKGYLFERPAVVAKLARRSGARWGLSGRLHKASHLFVYLKAQLIDARDGRVAADFVVELKGRGEKLTRRGTKMLAAQIVEALDALER